MSDFETQPCSTCNLPMLWAVTTKAKRMPIDPEPVDNGNIVLEWRGGPVPLARVVGTPRAGLYVSHFASCADAAAHRRHRYGKS